MKKLLALLLAAALVLATAACGNSDPVPADPTKSTTPNETTAQKGSESSDASEPTAAPTNNSGLYDRDSYTADAQTVAAAVDTVVATMGDARLTNGMLQVFYWLDVYNFINNYGGYLEFYGVDYSLPLDDQPYPGDQGTWQHYFLEAALGSWRNYQAMALMAEDENIPMDPELQKELDNLENTLAESAKQYQFDSVQALLEDDMGPGINLDSYKKYMTIYQRGYSYFNSKYAQIEVTQSMLEEYFTANKSELAEQGITKDSGFVCDVRHILVAVESDQTDANGNAIYTDADWAACEAEAQKLLDEWKNGEATEASFAFLASEHTDDEASAADGGLYTDLNQDTDFVEEFKNWYLSLNRKEGDVGLIQTEYGYHIMYFCDSELQWVRTCRNAILEEKSSEILQAAVNKYSAQINYDAILLGYVDLSKK